MKKQIGSKEVDFVAAIVLELLKKTPAFPEHQTGIVVKEIFGQAEVFLKEMDARFEVIGVGLKSEPIEVVGFDFIKEMQEKFSK